MAHNIVPYKMLDTIFNFLLHFPKFENIVMRFTVRSSLFSSNVHKQAYKRQPYTSHRTLTNTEMEFQAGFSGLADKRFSEMNE